MIEGGTDNASPAPQPLDPLEIAAAIIALAPSGLFDPAWYRATYPAAQGDPLVHFCNSGWQAGLRPNFYFDTAAYLACNDDVRLANLNPLLHYLQYGAAEDRPVSDYFDAAWYRKTFSPPTQTTCLADYLARCGTPMVSPNAGFDAGWYASHYVEAGAPDWFEHYTRHAAAGRAPSAEALTIQDSGLFDRDYYPRIYPHAAGFTLGALYHFCAIGWRLEQCNPNRVFDTKWYLSAYEDVRHARFNPLFHYIKCGELENRRPAEHFDPDLYRRTHALTPDQSCLLHYLSQPAIPQKLAAAAPLAAPTLTAPDAASSPRFEDELVIESELFDTNYYLINYPDVRQSGLHPIEHFRLYGWREGRRPNPYFDPAWYAQTYLAGQPGQNPLLHYIRFGEQTGMRPIVYFDPAWYRRHYNLPPAESPLRHFLKHRRSQTFSPTPQFDIAAYTQAHGAAMGANRDPFAHYLRVGISSDIDPGPDFDTKQYRVEKMSAQTARACPAPGGEIHEKLQRENLNPLVHFLLSEAALTL